MCSATTSCYFFFGRHHGFVPYFFPGVVAMVLFLLARGSRRAWQWLTLAGGLGSALFLILYMPFTYSGGGGPVGNRYYLASIRSSCFSRRRLRGSRAQLVAAGVGALFTAQPDVQSVLRVGPSRLSTQARAVSLAAGRD